jgi:hypothetical protein
MTNYTSTTETIRSHTNLVAGIFKQRGFVVDIYNRNVVCISLKNRNVYTHEVTFIIDSEELPIADEQVYRKYGNVYVKFNSDFC